MRDIDSYLAAKRLHDGRVVAVDWRPQGRGAVLCGMGLSWSSWEYPSITAALTAFLGWMPEMAEPVGYVQRKEWRDER